MYDTEAALPATADACRNLFVAQGWTPYGKAGDSDFFKQNAIVATATVSSAPAQGGKTMIQYSNQLISSDIPAPPDVEDLRYVDEPPELTFATANQDAIVDFYRKTLAAAGWKSTMDKMVDVDEEADHDLSQSPRRNDHAFDALRFKGQAARVGSLHKRGGNAELDRRIKRRLRASAARGGESSLPFKT